MDLSKCPKRGIFNHFDYHVGKDGCLAPKRHEILKQVFKSTLTDLPRTPTDDYGDDLNQWGDPASRRRLEKMLISLEHFRGNAVSEEAIADWSEEHRVVRRKAG